MKRSLFLFTLVILSLFSCIRKRDFDFDKIKWDDITPSWGLPLVNTKMSVADAINPTASSVIIDIDNNGFITLRYLDTITTPLGEGLFDKFKFPKSFFFQPKASFGAVPVPPAIGTTSTFPAISGYVPFQMDSLEAISSLSFKDGQLNLNVVSDYRHDITFKLTLPDLIDKNNIPFSTDFTIIYTKGVVPTVVPTDPKDKQFNLAGYKLSSASGQKNKIAYTVSNISLLVKGDNPTAANLILATDSLRFNLFMHELKYKYVMGKFMPLHIHPDSSTGSFLKGSTEIAVFKNTIDADIRFANPSMEFDFENSFGIVPSINIKNAEMQYAYSTSVKQFETLPNSVMQIPGNTIIAKSSTIGIPVRTPVILDKTTSNINQILTGAPNKFSYDISSISLSSDNEDAFISDDSQIKIYTSVKLPLHGAIKTLSLSDTIKNVEMIKPQNVDYIEFKIGSDNSIPLAVDLQAYFLDTAQIVEVNGKKTFKVLDSLITPPVSKAIVTAAIFDPNDLTKTGLTTLDRIVPISKEKYYNISFCNMIVVKGTLMTPDAQTSDVKFTTRQMFTYKLSAFAKLRINPARISEDDLINKSK